MRCHPFGLRALITQEIPERSSSTVRHSIDALNGGRSVAIAGPLMNPAKATLARDKFFMKAAR
jgi:hypothetical protein